MLAFSLCDDCWNWCWCCCSGSCCRFCVAYILTTLVYVCMTGSCNFLTIYRFFGYFYIQCRPSSLSPLWLYAKHLSHKWKSARVRGLPALVLTRCGAECVCHTQCIACNIITLHNITLVMRWFTWVTSLFFRFFFVGCWTFIFTIPKSNSGKCYACAKAYAALQ